ncbi:dual specificity protein kinase TTK-like [Montipora capricornis]|uniref:dual specificity protein kinase TTK-like n=1 Tax=Montipora capricornis TaxID=246305 RepID=UPI0035F12307
MDPETTTVTIQKIKENGNRPEEWLEFLCQHQTKVSTELTSEACQHLVFLYERAVNQIPAAEHKSNLSYARLLVECAKLQMRISEDDARRTFQLARSNAKHFAIVFVAWAQFELSLGNKSKCRGLLRKGKDVGAKPIELLIRAYDNFVEGKKVLIDDSDELTLTGFSRLKQKSSESSVDSSPMSQADDTTTGNGFTDNGIPSVADNTSGVISFKLPSIIESCRKQPVRFRPSTSSSSDETDSVPLQLRARCSMSTQKPSLKCTPDFRSANNSLVSSMNLSVRSNKTRRRPGHTGINFGLPMRVKMPQSVAKEAGDDLDGITELECTEDDPQKQRVLSEMKSVPQENHITAGNTATSAVPCRSEKENRTEENNRIGTTQNMAIQQELSRLHDTRDSGFVSKTADNTPSNPQSVTCSSTLIEECVKQSAPSCSSATLDNNKGEQQGEAPLDHRGVGFAPGYPPAMQFMSTLTPAQASQDIVVVKGKSYLRLGIIGRGGSSKVYRAFDGKRICAMKFVDLEEADDFMVQSYFNEIDLLNRLQGNDNIIKLFDWELNQEKRILILVMEYGSIDLAGFLRKNRTKMTNEELKAFWRQMLEAVNLVHQQGIIHRDLKPANFLWVEARLKLIDFGIAHTLQTDKTSIELDTQVGTLNFMSPEAFQDISQLPRFDSEGNSKPRLKIGRPSDVWSLGCILYMMVYGRTPFQHISNHVMKLQCIMDPSHEIEFPPIKEIYLLDVMKGCLRRNPKERLTIPHLLDHPFLNPSSHDPMVEIEDKVIECVMQIVKSDVNSPRSIRNFCKQRLAGNNT